MKKIVFIITLVALMLLTSVISYSEAIQYSDTGMVNITGHIDKAVGGEFVVAKLYSGEQLYYIDYTEADENGNYRFKFKCTGRADELSLAVNVNGVLANETVECAEWVNDVINCSLSFDKTDSGLKLIMNSENYFDADINYTMIIAFYNSDNGLTGCKVGEIKELICDSATDEIICDIPDDAIEVKGFLWSDYLIPLADNRTEKVSDFNQAVMFKFDDLQIGNVDRFDTVFSLLDEMGVKGSAGILVDSFAKADLNDSEVVKKINMVKKWIDNGHEIWLHGYYHNITVDDISYNEFSEPITYEQQYDSFKNSFDTVKALFGYDIETFGAPGNVISDETVRVLNDKFPQIKTIMCLNNISNLNKEMKAMHIPMASSNAAKCQIEGKNSDGKNVVLYDNFVNTYRADEEELIIQSHPPYWTNEDYLTELRSIISYIQNETDSVIMTPSEYNRIYR